MESINNDNNASPHGKQPGYQLPSAVGPPRAAEKQLASAGSGVNGIPANDPPNVQGQETNIIQQNPEPNRSQGSNRKSLIQTVEPYESTNLQRRNKKKEKLIKQAIRNDELNSLTQNNFPRHYVIRFPRINIDTELDIIGTQREILNKIGKYDGNIKKEGSSALLIKVKSREQGEKLKEVHQLAGKQVEVKEHRTLNQSKGTVYSRAMSNTPIETLKEALKEQHVVNIERMKMWVQGQLKETDRYILTFDRPDPPGTIKLSDWHRELVELFIPRPMRCSKCWKLGHTHKHCRAPELVCYQCAEVGHRGINCNRAARCINCCGDHRSTDKECPFYVFKCEVLATQVRLKYGYKEAEDDVKERFHASGKQHTFNRHRPNNMQEIRRRENQINEENNSIQRESTDSSMSEDEMVEDEIENRPAPKNLAHSNSTPVEYASSSEESHNDNTKAIPNQLNANPDEPQEHIGAKPKHSKGKAPPTKAASHAGKEPHQIQQPKSSKGKVSPTKVTKSAEEVHQLQHENPTQLEAPQEIENIMSLSMADIPLPDGSPKYEMRYDAWEDKDVPKPVPPPKHPPGTKVASIIRKIENSHPDWQKFGKHIVEKAAAADNNYTKLTKRKYKRKRKSLEKEEAMKRAKEDNKNQSKQE